MPSITGCHHVALTVTDADRSAEWYSSLLNMQIALSHDATMSGSPASRVAPSGHP